MLLKTSSFLFNQKKGYFWANNVNRKKFLHFYDCKTPERKRLFNGKHEYKDKSRNRKRKSSMFSLSAYR